MTGIFQWSDPPYPCKCKPTTNTASRVRVSWQLKRPQQEQDQKKSRKWKQKYALQSGIEDCECPLVEFYLYFDFSSALSRSSKGYSPNYMHALMTIFLVLHRVRCWCYTSEPHCSWAKKQWEHVGISAPHRESPTSVAPHSMFAPTTIGA